MILRCPICHEEVNKVNNSLVCSKRHSFDYASKGYINLLIHNSNKVHGDNKQMINARSSFLNADYYLSLKNKLVSIINNYPHQTLVDLACGTGYYTKDFICEEGYGFDLSKDAINLAAKNDPNHQYIVSSIFDLPIKDASCDIVTTIFAPLAKDEIKRILKDDGIAIVVIGGENHLIELKELLYEKVYQNDNNRIDFDLPLIDSIKVENKITLTSNQDIINLFMMTPYYYKTSKEDAMHLDVVESLSLTTSFIINIYQNKR